LRKLASIVNASSDYTNFILFRLTYETIKTASRDCAAYLFTAKSV